MARQQRRLAAIVSTDVVGYSRLMETDESGTHARLKARFQDLVAPKIKEFGGRIVKLMGDGLLAEFPSVVSAAEWAVHIQIAVVAANVEEPPGHRIEYRIGVNLGDVIIDGDDIYGDGVNVAARLQEIAVAGGVCLADDVYRQIRGKMTERFADGGEVSLKNISTPVKVWQWSATADGDDGIPKLAVSPPLPLPDKPSIAVLPFNNMSGNPEQEYFAEGITEDIITTLSKIPGLLVVARNSTFVYKGQSVDIKRVGSEQGVRYVLEGSTRRSEDRIRITAQLIDATTGLHVWADRYDRKLDDIFALQDEIAIRIVTELQIELLEGEMARLAGSGTSDINAWREQVRAVACTHVITKESYNQARRLSERAAAIDSSYAAPLATLGWVHWLEGRLGWSSDREASIESAHEFALKALSIDPENPEGHGVLGVVHMIEGRQAEAIKELVTGLDFSPNHANLTAYLSVTRTWNGEPDLGVNLAQHAMRLSPIFPAWYLGALGFALRRARRYSEAISALNGYASRQLSGGHVDLAIALAESQKLDQAQREAERILQYQPHFSISNWANTQMYRIASDLEEDVAALRRLNLPN